MFFMFRALFSLFSDQRSQHLSGWKCRFWELTDPLTLQKSDPGSNRSWNRSHETCCMFLMCLSVFRSSCCCSRLRTDVSAAAVDSTWVWQLLVLESREKDLHELIPSLLSLLLLSVSLSLPSGLRLQQPPLLLLQHLLSELWGQTGGWTGQTQRGETTTTVQKEVDARSCCCFHVLTEIVSVFDRWRSCCVLSLTETWRW